jgi:hypothetical protein
MWIETDWQPLRAVSLVFFWIGAAVWLAVALGAVVAFVRTCGCQDAPAAGTPDA